MPANTNGVPIGVAPYNRNDGFSPGSSIVARVPGLDNQAAFDQTNPVRLADMSRSFAPDAPIVVLDANTGQRALIWSELDSQAGDAQHTTLLIHPGKNFTEGHRYIVALRNLKDASGQPLQAPAWFVPFRDQHPRGGQGPGGALSLDFQVPAQGRGDQAQGPLRGVGLHGRESSEPHFAAALDPQQRLRTARRRQPLGPPGPGQRAHVHGHERAELHDRPEPEAPARGAGDLHRALLSDHRQLCDRRRLQLQLDEPGRHAHPAVGQRRHRAVRLHRPAGGGGGPGASLALRPRAARLADRGPRRERPEHGGGAQLRLLRHRLVGPRIGGRAVRHQRSSRFKQLPGGRRPAPAGRAQHPAPGAADGQPERLRLACGVPPGRKLAGRHLPPLSTTATARVGSWAASRLPWRPTTRAPCSA